MRYASRMPSPPDEIRARLRELDDAFSHVRGVPSEDVDDALAALLDGGDFASHRREYAVLLATAQCSDEQIAATLEARTSGDLYPTSPIDRAATAQARLVGRAALTVRAYSAATGETFLDKDAWAPLKEASYQWTGWTREGYDVHVRKALETAEKTVAAGGLRVVS